MKATFLALAVVTLVTFFTSCKKQLCVSVVDLQGTICCERCFDTQEQLDAFNATYTSSTCTQKCAD